MWDEEEAGSSMMSRLRATALLACLLAWLSLGVIVSQAYRAPLAHEAASKHAEEEEQNWLLGGLPEGPCGLAVTPGGGRLYVADYYHRAIDYFSPTGVFEGRQKLEGKEPGSPPINERNAVCG